jgi:hypothetical protein
MAKRAISSHDELRSQPEILAALRATVMLNVQCRAAPILRMHIPLLGRPDHFTTAVETFHQNHSPPTCWSTEPSAHPLTFAGVIIPPP